MSLLGMKRTKDQLSDDNVPTLKRSKHHDIIEGTPESEKEIEKTRTFTFELLSNIEDLHEVSALPSDESFSEIKQIILNYIEEKSSIIQEKQKYLALSSYESFNKLLESISLAVEKGNFSVVVSNKFSLIITKFKELISLQDKIKDKKLPSAAQKRWGLLKNFVRSGLALKNSDELSEEARKKGLPLGPLLIPEEQPLINLYPLVDTINRLAHSHREAGRWLFNHIKIFTFKELCASINEACLSLHQEISEFDGYHVLTIEGKSQEWVANIALRYLPVSKLPESYTRIDWNCLDGENFKRLKKSKYKNFIIFDDALYTGTQMCTIIGQLFNGIASTRCNNDNPETAIKLYIICGFSSNDAKNSIQEKAERLKKYNVVVTFICNRLFNLVGDDLMIEKVDAELISKVEDITSLKKSTVLTEWKTPDYVSTSQFITRGFMNYDSPCFCFPSTSLPQYQQHCYPFDEHAELHGEFQKKGTAPTNQITRPYAKLLKK